MEIALPHIDYLNIDISSLAESERITKWQRLIRDLCGINAEILADAGKMTVNQDLKIIRKQKLGDGAFGKVFRVLDRVGDERAMKIIHCKDDNGLIKQLKELFFQTRAQQSKCEYLNNCMKFQIVRSNGEYDCFAFMEMGVCDLKQILEIRMQRNMRYSNTDALISFMQLALGFGAIESQGIAHRDIKPANILYSLEKAAFQIADFGEGLLLRPRLMKTDMAGSPAYHAPELNAVYSADLPETPEIDVLRADIYSFGIVMYEMLTF